MRLFPQLRRYLNRMAAQTTVCATRDRKHLLRADRKGGHDAFGKDIFDKDKAALRRMHLKIVRRCDDIGAVQEPGASDQGGEPATAINESPVRSHYLHTIVQHPCKSRSGPRNRRAAIPTVQCWACSASLQKSSTSAFDAYLRKVVNVRHIHLGSESRPISGRSYLSRLQFSHPAIDLELDAEQ
jgi:hypothetical protein